MFFLGSFFWYCSGVKLSFDQKGVPKPFFPIACGCWDDRLSWPCLGEMHQKVNFRGTLHYGVSYLEFSFPRFGRLGQHAKPHDAAGTVQPKSCENPGFCYIKGCGPNACVLGDVTGLLSCLHVNFFWPPIFIFVGFGNCKSGMVLGFEVAGIDALEELVVFIYRIVQG